MEIIKYYVIVERIRKKFSQATLFNLKPESWSLYHLMIFLCHDCYKISWYICKTTFDLCHERNRIELGRMPLHCSVEHCKSRSSEHLESSEKIIWWFSFLEMNLCTTYLSMFFGLTSFFISRPMLIVVIGITLRPNCSVSISTTAIPVLLYSITL